MNRTPQFMVGCDSTSPVTWNWCLFMSPVLVQLLLPVLLRSDRRPVFLPPFSTQVLIILPDRRPMTHSGVPVSKMWLQLPVVSKMPVNKCCMRLPPCAVLYLCFVIGCDLSLGLHSLPELRET